MTTKISNAFAASMLLALILPITAAAQKITSLTSTAKGEGTITIGDVDKHKISAVLVILKENAEAEITLYTDLQLYGQGTWSVGDDIRKGIDLKITGGIVTGNATGVGKLILAEDNKTILKLTVEAKTDDRSKLKVDFTAKEKDKEQ